MNEIEMCSEPIPRGGIWTKVITEEYTEKMKKKKLRLQWNYSLFVDCGVCY